MQARRYIQTLPKMPKKDFYKTFDGANPQGEVSLATASADGHLETCYESSCEQNKMEGSCFFVTFFQKNKASWERFFFYFGEFGFDKLGISFSKKIFPHKVNIFNLDYVGQV